MSAEVPARTRMLWQLGVIVLSSFLLHSQADGAQEANSSNSHDSMLAILLAKVQQDPDHSDSWRLLGKVYQGQGKLERAHDAYTRALHLMFDNAAAHFDLGHLLMEVDREHAARFHFNKVFEIAPHSQYAQRLRELGMQPLANHSDWTIEAAAAELPLANDGNLVGGAGEIQPASFEIQTFDGSDEFNRRLDQLELLADESKRLQFYFEGGALYNSNVSLTPISRELARDDAASAQMFFNPEVDWIAWDNGQWRLATVARGYFTINESQQKSLSLSSFQPGVYLERDLVVGENPFILRTDYSYGIDWFGGDLLGDRHAVTASATSICQNGDVVYLYGTVAFSQFEDDGWFPEFDSLDGNTYAAGISRFFVTDWYRLPGYSLGFDVELADTEGADHRYGSARIHGDATLTLTERLNFVASSGFGYRDYYDFSGSVSRDEFTWRAAGRLTHQFTSYFSTSIVANYDRFASENENFDVDRFTAGIVTTLQY